MNNKLLTNKNRRVLVIDDNRAIHDDFRKILCPASATAAALDATEAAVFGPGADKVEQTNFEVDSAYQGQEGVLMVEKALEVGLPYALAFVDMRMPPGIDGVKTIRKIWEIDPDIQIVICTAFSDLSWVEIFEELDQRDGLLILKKPFDAVEAFQLGHAFIEKWWLNQQNRRKMEELDRLVAERTAELTKSESLYRSLVENEPQHIFRKDRAFRFTFGNDLFCRSLGKPLAQIIGKTDRDLFPAPLAAKYLQADQRVIETGQPFEGDEENWQADGKTLFVHVIRTPLLDGEGRIIGIQCIAFDITERKQAEVTLHESENKFRELNALGELLLPPNPIEKKLQLVTDTVVRVFDADLARIWMIKPGDHCQTGCAHASVSEGPHMCRYRDKCLHLLASSGRYTHTTGEVHARVPFGCYKIGTIAAGEDSGFLTNEVATDQRVHNHAWAKELGLKAFAGYRMLDAAGASCGVLAVFSKHAISDSQNLLLQGFAHLAAQTLISARAEESLRLSEAKWRTLFNESAGGLILADPATQKFRSVNNSICQMLGYTGEELLALDVARLHPPADLPEGQSAFQRMVCGENKVATELPMLRKDGSVFYADVTGTIIAMAGEQLLLGAFQDVTERRHATQELARSFAHLEKLVAERTKNLDDARTAALSLMQDAQRQGEKIAAALTVQHALTTQLDAANKELEAFSYSVSHDLRAPLRHIDAFTTLLAKQASTLDDKGREYLTVIKEATGKMSHLIDDLLLFSRMGRVELSRTNVLLDGLVRDVIRDLTPETQGRQIEWLIQPLPVVSADLPVLRQVFANLLGNAVKYTGPRERARIEIGSVPGADPGAPVTLFVRDNGVGFNMQYAPKLFNVFQRLHSESEFKGTGIGLANVRRIIQRHGGRTWAEGQVDSGATFYFTLPVGPVSEAAPPT